MRLVGASRRSDPRAPSTTFAPRSASSSAVASPIPLLAPVIATILSFVPDITSPFHLPLEQRLRLGSETLNTWAFVKSARSFKGFRKRTLDQSLVMGHFDVR